MLEKELVTHQEFIFTKRKKIQEPTILEKQKLQPKETLETLLAYRFTQSPKNKNLPHLRF